MPGCFLAHQTQKRSVGRLYSLKRLRGGLALDFVDSGLQVAVNRFRPAFALHVEIAHEGLA
eukprot:1449588-Lingulodinium_polyedra.AAC.1